MKRRTKIVLWIYLIGFVLAECSGLRTGYVFGAFANMHSVGDFALWLLVNTLIAAAWPIWTVMIVLQLLGIEF